MRIPRNVYPIKKHLCKWKLERYTKIDMYFTPPMGRGGGGSLGWLVGLDNGWLIPNSTSF